MGFSDFMTSDLFLSKVKGQIMGQIDAGLMPDYNAMMGFKKLNHVWRHDVLTWHHVTSWLIWEL